MTCCVLMAGIWCVALGLKAWLTGAVHRRDRTRTAQDWRLANLTKRNDS